MADIIRLDQNHRRSRAVIHGSVVYLAGQVADDKSVTVAEQTRQALAKVDAMLRQAGTDKSRLLTAQVWLNSMADYDAMNVVWDGWISPGDAPTRCCGETRLADPDWKIEVVVTAAL